MTDDPSPSESRNAPVEAVGPVGQGTLEPHAHDKPVMERLWAVSEQATAFAWSL